MKKMLCALAAVAALAPFAAQADDSLLKSIMDADGPGITHGVDVGDPGGGNGGDPSSSEPPPPLNVGDVCTDDPRCADEPGVAAGTGREEKQYHLGYLQVPGANPDTFYIVGFPGPSIDDWRDPQPPSEEPAPTPEPDPPASEEPDPVDPPSE